MHKPLWMIIYKNWTRLHWIILVALYTISLLFWGRLAIGSLFISLVDTRGLDPISAIVLVGLTPIVGAAGGALAWLEILVQLPFYAGLVFKPQWLEEHMSFRYGAWLMLLAPYLIFMLLEGLLMLGV